MRGGKAVWRYGGRSFLVRSALGAVLLTGLPPYRPTALAAQVGHPPSSSPYRDIPRSAGPVLSFGYLTGAEGKVGVGITNALTAGVRYDLPLGSALRIAFGVSYGIGKRFLIDPTQDSASRKSGPVDDAFLLADGELQLLISGHKTWHGLAPYLTAGAGFVLGGTEPAADTSDYALGTKFVFTPGAGVRWYLTRRLSVQLDGRFVFLKLRYPPAYYVPASDGTAVLRLDEDDQEWTRRPSLRVGIGWTF